MVQYLLPCQCGRKIPVDSTKAGQFITCECGVQLEIPTLGGLRKLQPVVQENRPVARVKWAARQQVLLLGIIICIVGLGIAGLFAIGRPLPPPHEQRIEVFPKYVEGMSLMQTIQLWSKLERGLPDGLGLEDQRYQTLRQAYLRRSTVALVIAGVGVVIMLISLFIPKKRVRSMPR